MYFKYKNINMYYEKIGNKKNSLLILPGWGNNRTTFDKMVNILKEKYTIYTFDYPGFGNSKFPNKDLTIYDYAELFINFMKIKKILKPTIIGHSFGGRVIITMCGYYNIKFNKIILIDSAGIKPKKTKKQLLKQKLYKILKKICNIFPNKIKKKCNNILINIFGSSDYKSIPNIIRKTFLNIVNEDLTKYLENINCETLIIWGKKDIDTPIDNAYKFNNLIKDSGLIIIEKAGHFSYIEQQIYVNIIIYNYLQTP